MKNSIYNILKSKVILKIIGINKERIIKRLKNNNIEILNIKYIEKGIIVKIYKKDYGKLLSIKTIYELEIINYNGLYAFKNKVLNNKYIIISILVCLIILYIVTNLIFSIDIITNDSNMKIKIEEELNNNGVSKYKFKKSYKELQNIKNNILSKYRSEIEWIEIEVIGTKYIIRYEPRIQNNIETNNNYRNIIASKNCLIKDMYVTSGQIIKNKNTYVKKGEIIVSGYIYLNDSIKDTVSASGTIYGECWYNVTVTYPFKYHEEKETGNSKNVIVIKLLNKEIELFNFNKYKDKKVNNTTLLKNNILPIKLIYQKQKEVTIIDENNTEEVSIEKAINYSKEKLKNNLDSDEYVNDYKILNKEIFSDSVKLNIFFSVIENITEYEDIEEYKELEEQNIVDK